LIVGIPAALLGAVVIEPLALRDAIISTTTPTAVLFGFLPIPAARRTLLRAGKIIKVVPDSLAIFRFVRHVASGDDFRFLVRNGTRQKRRVEMVQHVSTGRRERHGGCHVNTVDGNDSGSVDIDTNRDRDVLSVHGRNNLSVDKLGRQNRFPLDDMVEHDGGHMVGQDVMLELAAVVVVIVVRVRQVETVSWKTVLEIIQGFRRRQENSKGTIVGRKFAFEFGNVCREPIKTLLRNFVEKCTITITADTAGGAGSAGSTGTACGAVVVG